MADIIGAVDSARRVLRVAQRHMAPALFGESIGAAPVRVRPPLPLRVDTDETYRPYVADRARGSQHYPELVESLRRAFEEHVSDGHGGHITEIVGDIHLLRDAVLCGDGAIPLSLPPSAHGVVRCWKQGDHICCSMRVPGKDGRARIVTTCSPIARHVDEVLGYAQEAGIDEIEALSWLPDFTLVHGGGSLLRPLAEAAPAAGESTVAPRFGMIAPDGKVTWK